MKLIVFSHKVCWKSEKSKSGYATDGGFAFQMKAISTIFDETCLLLPVDQETKTRQGSVFLEGDNLEIESLSMPIGRGFVRKITFPFWIILNLYKMISLMLRADAVHAPIPGDIGTIGMLLAVVFKKPLFVRHCGNWTNQRTVAEKFWKWFMENFAGGTNVMFATGGGSESPSMKNKNIEWIFATSLTENEIKEFRLMKKEVDLLNINLVIVCRQNQQKGTGVVIESLPYILKKYPNLTFHVVGDGPDLGDFKNMADQLGVVSKVRFHGNMNHKDVMSLLKQSTLFCYPTKSSEGFPKVVLEALAAGLPVVTTPVSVLPSLINQGCGMIVDPVTPESFGKAIDLILGNANIYQNMSLKAYEISETYSLESWRQRIARKLTKQWGLNLKLS